MPQVLVGTVANDGTGDPLRTAFLKVNQYGILNDKTINAAFFKTASNTWEAAINLAIPAAALLGPGAAVWIPASGLPYNASLVTFNTAVKMLREGGNPDYYDVHAYGAAGNGVADDLIAIRAAITACFGNGLQPFGGVVYFSAGQYVFTGTIQVPVCANISIVLRGAGMRNTYLYPSGPSTNFTANSDGQRVCMCIGTLTPDAAGTFTNVTSYQGWEELSQNGTLITSGSVVAHQLTEVNYSWMQNGIIENFPNASVGLYLRGSTVTGGLGTGNTAPHTRLVKFDNMLVVTIGSNNLGGSPVVLQNADENDWYNCDHGCTPGQTVGADSYVSTLISMGRNNRFFGVLYAGDTTALKTGYVGLKFGPPVNAAGAPNGGVLQNQDYGAVAEGFNKCFWVAADASGNTVGNYVSCAHPSIYNTAWQDDTQPTVPGGFQNGGQGGNCFFSPLLNLNTAAVRQQSAPVCLLGQNNTTPNITGSNTWQTQNTLPTVITDFLSGTVPQQDGQRLLIRFTDTNTTIRDVANGGGGNIRNLGRQDIIGLSEMIVEYQRIGTLWFQIGPIRLEGGILPVTGGGATATKGFLYLASETGIPTGTPTDLPSFAVPFVVDTTTKQFWTYTGAAWRAFKALFTDAGKTTAGTSDASITSFPLPASSLLTNTQGIRIVARGRQATQAGSFNIKFGATVLGTVAPAAGANWEFEATVTRTGAATQLANGRTVQGTTIAIIAAQPAETLSGAITVDFRGSVTSGGTLSLDYASVEYLAQ